MSRLEPTIPASTCLPAPAPTESLCRISLQPHSRPPLHPLSATSSRSLPPRTLPTIRIHTTHHQPPIPAASAQHHSNPIANQLPAAAFKSLYPKRPHSRQSDQLKKMGAPDTALGLSRHFVSYGQSPTLAVASCGLIHSTTRRRSNRRGWRAVTMKRSFC
jgi:hypothetical protein